MNAILANSIHDWLDFEILDEVNCYKSKFNDTHIGNPIIRSVHGGVSASLIELSARETLRAHLQTAADKITTVSSSVDYLRVTKAADLYAHATIVRTGRRIAFVEVLVWQDNRETAIAKGSCVFKLDN